MLFTFPLTKRAIPSTKSLMEKRLRTFWNTFSTVRKNWSVALRHGLRNASRMEKSVLRKARNSFQITVQGCMATPIWKTDSGLLSIKFKYATEKKQIASASFLFSISTITQWWPLQSLKSCIDPSRLNKPAFHCNGIIHYRKHRFQVSRKSTQHHWFQWCHSHSYSISKLIRIRYSMVWIRPHKQWQAKWKQVSNYSKLLCKKSSHFDKLNKL